MFPNTTAAFRASPRRFARFIGELRNAALKSSWLSDSKSRASVRARASYWAWLLLERPPPGSVPLDALANGLLSAVSCAMIL